MDDSPIDIEASAGNKGRRKKKPIAVTIALHGDAACRQNIKSTIQKASQK